MSIENDSTLNNLDAMNKEDLARHKRERSVHYAEMIYGMSFANPNHPLGAAMLSDAARAQRAFDAATAFVEEMDRRGLIR